MKMNNIILFTSLALFRILNALLLQTQFDPDEYWQTLEPAYCEVFNSERYSCAYTWEWKRRGSSSSIMEQMLHGPVRSYLSIIPTYAYYKIVRILHPCCPSFWISKGPLLWNAIFVTATTDFFTWFVVANNLDDNYSSTTAWWTLFFSTTSWFQGYTLSRTYSNSIETMLLILGMTLLRSNNRNERKNSDATSIRPKLAFILGGMSVSIRFTALAAWVPLGILWALNKSKKVTKKEMLLLLLNNCALYGVVGVCISMMVDRYFYGFWTLPLLGNLHFNVLEGLGSLYGTHPFYWYLIVGIPVMAGLLLPILIVDLISLISPTREKQQLRIDCWIVIICYVILHSFSSHKEFRFLLPILPLMCIIAGQFISDISFLRVQERKFKMILVAVFPIVNLIAFLYLGLIHQRAPLDVNEAIVKYIQQNEDKLHLANNGSVVSIHYLMGCHSTPLFSHLHIPNGTTKVQAWHLDCSPDCRSSVMSTCESERFTTDPVTFIETAYGVTNKKSTLSCNTIGPDIAVLFSEESHKLRPQLNAIDLYETQRFFHRIGGISIPGIGDTGDDFNNPAYSRWNITSGVELSFQEIILYTKKI